MSIDEKRFRLVGITLTGSTRVPKAACGSLTSAAMPLSVLVTVGTTQFAALTDYVTEPATLEALRTSGVTSLTVQHGHAALSLPATTPSHPALTAFSFTPQLREHLAAADVVVAHAGAGTIVEAVALRKRLLVVVNNALMHNHQTELADAMRRRGCCVVTSAAALRDEFVEKLTQAIALDVDAARPPERVPYALAHVLRQQLSE